MREKMKTGTKWFEQVGIASAVNTLLTYAGVLTNYYSSVVYHRYVMINGRGPYFECDKITEYNGWARKNNSSTARIEDLGTKYSVTQEIFVSYSRQREKAYANYRWWKKRYSGQLCFLYLILYFPFLSFAFCPSWRCQASQSAFGRRPRFAVSLSDAW